MVLTRFDDYKRDNGMTDFDFKRFISKLPSERQSLLRSTFKDRYIRFDNTLSGRNALHQVAQLMQNVNDIIANNNGSNYTNDDFPWSVLCTVVCIFAWLRCFVKIFSVATFKFWLLLVCLFVNSKVDGIVFIMHFYGLNLFTLIPSPIGIKTAINVLHIWSAKLNFKLLNMILDENYTNHNQDTSMRLWLNALLQIQIEKSVEWGCR